MLPRPLVRGALTCSRGARAPLQVSEGGFGPVTGLGTAWPPGSKCICPSPGTALGSGSERAPSQRKGPMGRSPTRGAGPSQASRVLPDKAVLDLTCVWWSQF